MEEEEELTQGHSMIRHEQLIYLSRQGTQERGARDPKASLVQLDKYEGSGNGLCTKGRIGYKYKNETHKPQSES